MRIAVVNDGIVTNIIEAPMIYEDNQKICYDWTQLREPYTDVEPLEYAKERMIKEYTTTVQSYLDTTAQEHGYDNILSLCTYATSAIPKFKLEGQAGVYFRDAVWSNCYEILADVQAGTREVPEDIISELPVINWGDDV